MRKALTPWRQLQGDRFATCGLLMISIFWETVQKNSNQQQLAERLEKIAAGYDMEIVSNNSKILINSTKPRPSIYQHLNE